MLKERIDLHGHYFPPAYCALLQRYHIDSPDGVKAPFWSVERQFEYMQQLNISFSTLSLSSPHIHFGDSCEAAETARSCNEYGAAIAKQYPGKFGILASLPLPDIDASVQEIKYCRDVLGINGFALLTNYRGVYLGDALLDPVMDEMNRRETLVTIHPTLPQQLIPGAASELPGPVMEYFFETTRSVVNMLLKGVLRKYKNLRFVIPHGGAFLTILSDRLIPMTSMLLKDSDIDIGGDLSHLYYDLAGFSMPKQFDLLRTITDDSHLFYGSDSPYTFLPVCIKQAELMDIKLGDVLSKKIYIDNPQKLFNDIGIFS